MNLSARGTTWTPPGPRRAGPAGQPAGRIWHTLVYCSLTTAYRPVRPPVGAGSAVLLTLSKNLLTISNIFQFVMT